MKLCAWCEKEIVRPRKISEAEWATRFLHKLCVMSWRHHKCAKSQVIHPPERECRACSRVLVRREGENWQAWEKRSTCNKKCAAMGSVRIRRPVVEAAKEEQLRVGVVQYVPGSPEFKQIAALYGG